MHCKQWLKEHLWLMCKIYWQHSQDITVTFFTFFWMWKRETCWMHFNVNFNIDISIAAIYEIFDIHELAEFTGNFFYLFDFILIDWFFFFFFFYFFYLVIFYFTENCFLVCHLLFMIDYLLFMIDFRIPHANFKFLFWLFSECPCWWFLIKNIEENIHGYVLSCSVSASKDFLLNEYVFSIFIYLISEMMNCLMELAIPN